MYIIDNCVENKIYRVLKDFGESGKACILFNHGLGDYCLFLPLFNSLCEKFPKWDIKIGYSPERNYYFIHPNSVVMNGPYGKYEDIYDIIFNLTYYEPPRNDKEFIYLNSKIGHVRKLKTISKPYLCNELEIGLEYFKWKPYKLNIELENNNSNLIGVHFFGHTSVQNKDLSYDKGEIIWEEIKKAGYEPFEIQMIPLNLLDSTEIPYFINRNNSIRFEFPNIRIMSKKISQCKYFIGVDSGPLYLAGSILGFDKCIGLERLRKFDKVLPIEIKKIDAEKYINGSVFNLLKELN